MKLPSLTSAKFSSCLLEQLHDNLPGLLRKVAQILLLARCRVRVVGEFEDSKSLQEDHPLHLLTL